MTTPGRLDLSIYRGDTFEFTLHFQDDATPPVPIDMSGKTFASQVRKANSEDLVVSFTVDTSDAANGNLVLGITATVAATLPIGCFDWDFQETTGAVVNTLLAGDAQITKDVTQP